MTFHSEFVSSLYQALEEERRQAERELQAEQDGYVCMQSVSLKRSREKEVTDGEMEAEEEERPYYNVIPLPKS